MNSSRRRREVRTPIACAVFSLTPSAYISSPMSEATRRVVANTTTATMTTVRIPLAVADPPDHSVPVSERPIEPPSQFA